MINIKKALFKVGIVLLAAHALHSPAYANDAPNVSPTLKKMLGGLPIAGMKDQLQQLVGALKQTPCGGKLTGCYATQSGPLQLYLFSSQSAQQTFLLVIDQKMAMPTLLKGDVQKLLGGTSLQSPIISISTTNYTLDKISMPPALQKVVNDNYFGVSSLEFESGVQLAARASLGGAIKLVMESMGAKVDQLTMRAAVVMPIPTDLMGGAGTGAGLAAAVTEGNTMKKAGTDAAKPEAYIEFQFGPDSVVKMNYPQIRLTDATFFLNNSLTFGYKGNAAFAGATDKKVLMHFQTPLNPAGGMDLLDFQFLMATPATFTLEDAAHVMVAMASPDPRLAKYGGGFIRNINAYKNALLNMTKPLSMFKVTNPKPAPEYRFGDATKPFPQDVNVFNFVILGPLADGGPKLRAVAELNVMGQKLGWMEASSGNDGFKSTVGESITVKLGPLGRQTFKVISTNSIDMLVSTMNLKGSFAGQSIEVTWSPIEVALKMNASCISPFEINASAKITPDLDLAQFFDLQPGVNVDPSKFTGCTVAELEKAYKWVASTGKNLGGYAASAANAELNKISNEATKVAKAQADAAAALAQQQAAAARAEYNKVKNAARNVANNSTSAATNALKDAGNKISGLFGKKKANDTNDKFDRSIFNWDYYYDTRGKRWGNTDLVQYWVDHGYANGERASLEFDLVYYRNRHPNVSDKNLLNYWLKDGINGCDQASADFSLRHLLNRYPSAGSNCRAQLDNWFDQGGAGLNANPDERFDRSVFDWNYYYDNHPDVVRSGYDLATHWRDHGFQEGRQGSLEFRAKDYLARYPDLQRAFGANNYGAALSHWLNSGQVEGRQSSPDFSVRAYLARYPDLQQAFGANNYDAALDHWFDKGEAEGRNSRP